MSAGQEDTNTQMRYLYLSKLVKISGASGAIARLILDQLHVNIFGRGAYHVSRLAIYWLENPMTRKQKNFLEIWQTQKTIDHAALNYPKNEKNGEN